MLRLFPDGSIRAENDAGDNTIRLGDSAPTILSWQLPPDTRENQELIITCEFISHGALRAFDGPAAFGIWREWHMGFMLRSVIGDIPAGHYKGLGPIFGRVWRPENNLPEQIPPYVTSPGLAGFRLEDWGNGVLPSPAYEYLRAHSEIAAQDDTRYRLMMSCKRYAGEVYSRYVVGALNANRQYPPIFDSGDVQSNNWAMDRYNEALSIFNIGGVGVCDYSVEIINLNAHQQEATCRIPDMRFAVPR